MSGRIQEAIDRYVQEGDLDSLAALMNEPWASTDTGGAILREAIAKASSKAQSDKSARQHKEMVRLMGEVW